MTEIRVYCPVCRQTLFEHYVCGDFWVSCVCTKSDHHASQLACLKEWIEKVEIKLEKSLNEMR